MFDTGFKAVSTLILSQLVAALQLADSIRYWSCHSGISPAPSGIYSLGVVERGPATLVSSPLLCLTDCIRKDDSGEWTETKKPSSVMAITQKRVYLKGDWRFNACHVSETEVKFLV